VQLSSFGCKLGEQRWTTIRMNWLSCRLESLVGYQRQQTGYVCPRNNGTRESEGWCYEVRNEGSDEGEESEQDS